MGDKRQHCAAAYRRLLEDVHRESGCAEGEEEVPLPGELEVQALWHAGLLGYGGKTLRHGEVRILDFGEWNRSVGPDFLRAEIEIAGTRMRGDIEIDPTAQDWEKHGHGANPNYTNVVLHVVLTPPPQGWYTRNEQHLDVPILPIDARTIREAMGHSEPLSVEHAGLCREPLNSMPASDIDQLLQAAAAYRAQKKRSLFCRKAEVMGSEQAWFEAFAETLGYRINKAAMQMLARRAPLHRLRKDTESILFGTAGFLVPVLPERADSGAREYHRSVWDGWWAHREDFALGKGRSLPWQYAPLRPVNHPHRRVAALALIATHWKEVRDKLDAAHAADLTRFLTGLKHPYWSERCSLPSPVLKNPAALFGAERAKDFLVNHVYIQDEAPFAWETYLSLKNRDIPQRVKLTAQHLFGQREDILPLLPRMYVQQALLQIDADFCVQNSCRHCLFPEQLCQWRTAAYSGE